MKLFCVAALLSAVLSAPALASDGAAAASQTTYIRVPAATRIVDLERSGCSLSAAQDHLTFMPGSWTFPGWRFQFVSYDSQAVVFRLGSRLEIRNAEVKATSHVTEQTQESNPDDLLYSVPYYYTKTYNYNELVIDTVASNGHTYRFTTGPALESSETEGVVNGENFENRVDGSLTVGSLEAKGPFIVVCPAQEVN